MEEPGRREAGALARALRIERTMIWVRWGSVGFAVVQIFTYYRPHPAGMMGYALAVAGLLAAGNAAVHVAVRRRPAIAAARSMSLAVLVLDTMIVMAFVFIYTFDPDTAMWAVVYVLPLEGAIRFQLRGALGTMAAAAAAYTARELYGTAVYGNEFIATSISFRMGIGFLIATVAGAMASGLVREHERLEQARDRLERAKTSLEASAAELEAANEELRAANAIKDDFLAMTNHEVRTPLTTILGYAATLRLHWDELSPAQRSEFLTRVEEQGQRLLTLVEGLLTLSSAQAGGLRVDAQPVVLHAVITGAVDDNGQQAGDVEVRCPEELVVLADPVRLRQILTNYVANALKYGRDPVIVTARANGDHAEVCVVDHGTGVPEDFVPRLFDRFTRASNGAGPLGGAGLGLAIVRKLVEAQGGEAWYEPNTPTGSCFCLRLPLAPLVTPHD